MTKTRTAIAGACLVASLGCGPREADANRSTAAATDTLLPINGTRLFVHREGSGEPAIVVHGGPVLDQSYLRPYLAPLADSLELIYYDQRLSGRSDGQVDSASVRLDTFVDDVEALRAALNLGRVHLIAHSWGGLVAMKYAIRHPDRLRSLVLLDPMPPSAALWQAEETALQKSLTAADTAGSGALRSAPGVAEGRPDAIAALLRHSFRSQFRNPGLADSLAFLIPPDYRERSRQFGYLMPDLLAFDLRRELEAVSVPALVLYGEDEPGRTLGGDAIAAAMPRATRATVAGAGHFPFMERPAEFLDTVRRFLSAVGEGR